MLTVTTATPAAIEEHRFQSSSEISSVFGDHEADYGAGYTVYESTVSSGDSAYGREEKYRHTGPAHRFGLQLLYNGYYMVKN